MPTQINAENRVLNLPQPGDGCEVPNSPLYNIYNLRRAYVTEHKIHDLLKQTTISGSYTTILHLNCRGLGKNYDSIENLIDIIVYQLTAICVTESWVSANAATIYNFPNYTFFSNPRTLKSSGGLGIFVHDESNSFLRQDLCLMLPHIETIFIEVVYANAQNILVGCIYRPPNSDSTLFNNEMGL